jgi:hypothetical protein
MKAFSQLLEDVYGHDKSVAHATLQTFGFKQKSQHDSWDHSRTKSVYGSAHNGDIHVYHEPASKKLTWHHMNSRGRLKRSGEGHESLHSHLRLTNQ